MIRQILLSLVILCVCSYSYAQDTSTFDANRFADISETESKIDASTITSRMIEGLGFRYYWATEGLTSDDLKFKPVEEGRSSLETLKHIYGLTNYLVGFFGMTPSWENDFKQLKPLREATLLNFQKLEKKVKSIPQNELKSYKKDDITIWQMINGPIADAIYHTGQIVLLRRMSGNPLPEGVNLMMGTKN